MTAEPIIETLRKRIGDVYVVLDQLVLAPNEAEAVHDYRVALRRLRSSLRVLEIDLGKRALRPIGEALRGAADLTGELRDEEVLRETLSDLRAIGKTELDRWMVGRARRERGLRARVLRVLQTEVQGSLRATLANLSKLVADELGSDPAKDAAIAAEAIQVAFEKVERRGLAAHEDDSSAMHRLRIAVKQLRYSIELVGAHVSIDRPSVDRLTTKLQKLLGKLHDLDQAIARMDRAWGLERAVRAKVLEALATSRRKTAHKAVKEFRSSLEELRTLLRPALGVPDDSV